MFFLLVQLFVDLGGFRDAFGGSLGGVSIPGSLIPPPSPFRKVGLGAGIGGGGFNFGPEKLPKRALTADWLLISARVFSNHFST